MSRLLRSGLLSPALLHIRAEAMRAWYEAWWAKIPHCQLGNDGRGGNLTWYWP